MLALSFAATWLLSDVYIHPGSSSYFVRLLYPRVGCVAVLFNVSPLSPTVLAVEQPPSQGREGNENTRQRNRASPISILSVRLRTYSIRFIFGCVAVLCNISPLNPTVTTAIITGTTRQSCEPHLDTPSFRYEYSVQFIYSGSMNTWTCKYNIHQVSGMW